MLSHAQVLKIVRSLIGLKPWRLKLGIGSFVTIEFGEPEASPHGRVRHGEWHLWFYMCRWKFVERGQALVDSDDERTLTQKTFENLELGYVESVLIPRTSVNLQLKRSTELLIRTTSTSSKQNVLQ